MKKEKVWPGMLVAVNTREDCQLYRVGEIQDFLVNLMYRNCDTGEMFNGGITDVSNLLDPTKKQLLHYIRTLEAGKERAEIEFSTNKGE